MDSFKVIVGCGTPGASHEHEVTISHGGEVTVGAGPPAKVRLQYTCPISGTTRMMTFNPPDGAARPFVIMAVA